MCWDLELSRITVACARKYHDGRAGRHLDLTDGVVVPAIRKWDLTGLSIRSVSSRKAGILLRSSRSSCLESGFSPMIRIAELTSFVVVSVPAANRKVDRFITSSISGVEPSSYLASASSVSTSPRGCRLRSSI